MVSLGGDEMKFWIRLYHGLFGHPSNQIEWGETSAKCNCGVEFSLFDLYPFM